MNGYVENAKFAIIDAISDTCSAVDLAMVYGELLAVLRYRLEITMAALINEDDGGITNE